MSGFLDSLPSASSLRRYRDRQTHAPHWRGEGGGGEEEEDERERARARENEEISERGMRVREKKKRIVRGRSVSKRADRYVRTGDQTKPKHEQHNNNTASNNNNNDDNVLQELLRVGHRSAEPDGEAAKHDAEQEREPG